MRQKSIIFIFFVLLLLNSNKCYGENNYYLALGDSIAYGFNLENRNSDSYTEIVRKELGIDESEYKNLAIPGVTCQEYYNIIQDSQYKDEIKKASLVTLSIGSNEILKIATEGIERVSNVSSKENDFFGKVQESFNEASIIKRYEMIKELYDYFNSEECEDKINNSLKVYEEYWQKTINYIQKINPKSIIVATEFYNPYYGIRIGNYNIGNFSDIPIKKMNEILWRNSKNEKQYKIAKIYNAFNNDEFRMTNAEVNTAVTRFHVNMDPHPNKNGHKLIAEKIIEKVLDTRINAETNIEKTFVSQEKSLSNYSKSDNHYIPYIVIIIGIILTVVFFRRIVKSK